MTRRFSRTFVIGVVILAISFVSCTTGGGSPDTSISETLADSSPELQSAPPPVWRLPVMESEVTNAQLLGGNVIVATTAKVFGTMQSWGLKNSTILFGDIETGKVMWRAELNDLSGSVEEIFDGGEIALLNGVDYSAGKRRLSAATVASGDVVWTGLFPASFTFSYDIERNAVFGAGGTEGEAFKVVSLDASTGKVSWEYVLPGDFARPESRKCDLFITENGILVVGESVVMLNPENGKPLWSAGFDLPRDGTTTSQLAAGELLLNFDGRLTLIDLDTGMQRWNHGTSGTTIVAQIVSDGRVFMVSEDGEQNSTLAAIDIPTGGLLWATEVSGSIHSGLYIYDGILYLTTSDTLRSFDAGTGTASGKATFPDFLWSEYGLPDQLKRLDGRLIVVAREIGVIACDIDTLKPVYAHGVDGTDVYTFHAASQRLIMRQFARSGGGPGFDTVGLTQELQRQAIRNNTGAEPEFAQGVPRTANQSLTEATMAAASMASSIAAAGIAFREDAVANNMQINEREIVAAMGMHRLSLQDDYYIRPFQREAWGYTIVRLSDGARADLYVSISYEPLLINSGNFPVFFVDTDTRRLIVNGIGREVRQDETFTKVGFGKDVYKVWPGIPPNWTIPYTSLFAYDIDSLDFSPAGSFEPPSARPRIGGPEVRLRDAILSRDRDEVSNLVEEGADVNAVDGAGFNSLFYAAMIDDKRIAQILIDAGADATFRDPHGLLAYHYTFLTHGDNRSTEVFRKANMAQQRNAVD